MTADTTADTARHCKACGTTKPVAEFYVTATGPARRCRTCERVAAIRNQQKRRERMGDAAYLAQRLATQTRMRANPAMRERERNAGRARNRALERLRRAHPDEYLQHLNAERTLVGLHPLAQLAEKGTP